MHGPQGSLHKLAMGDFQSTTFVATTCRSLLTVQLTSSRLTVAVWVLTPHSRPLRRPVFPLPVISSQGPILFRAQTPVDLMILCGGEGLVDLRTYRQLNLVWGAKPVPASTRAAGSTDASQASNVLQVEKVERAPGTNEATRNLS